MKFTKLINAFAAASLLFSVACSEEGVFVEKGTYDKGVLVSYEGGFMKNNADIAFIPQDISKIEADIYKLNNGQPLGDVLQSLAFDGDKAFIVVNNSNKIEVVNRYGFKKLTTLTNNIKQPRYIAFAQNNMYVTNSTYNGDQYLGIYNKNDYSFITKIEFSDIVERVVEAGNKIFVQHASYGYGNTISVINTTINTVENTITIPNGGITKTISYNNKVYVLASGLADSFLYEINPSDNSISKAMTLTNIPNATNLDVASDIFYFTSNNQVYRLPMSSNAVPTQSLFSVNNSPGIMYGFNVIDGKIFTSDAKDFSAGSEIKIYSLTGELQKTFTSGTGVNGFYKN